MRINMGSVEESHAIRISPSSSHAFAKSVLVSYGVSTDRADIVADALVLADLRGVDSHGINRLPSYVARIKAGVLATNPVLEFEYKTPVLAMLDAKNTFGFVAGSLAIDEGIKIASTYGLAVVGVKHSNHYGMASTYILRAVQQGFAAFAFTNASRSMPPWGGKEPLFGTSPFAVGVPGGQAGNFVLDMSPSVAARGKIRKAARRGEPIPEGYALDKDGKPTTDAKAALDGVVLPIGGPKGSGLAMMMDIFGGLLTGAAFAGDVVDMNKNATTPQNVGHWFLLYRPEAFLDSREELHARMDKLLDRTRKCEKADGFERIYVSGEMETEREIENRKMGILYTQGEIEALHQLAKEIGSKALLEPMM